MTVITLNISEPKTPIHLTPSLGDVREIQIIDFNLFVFENLSSG